MTRVRWVPLWRASAAWGLLVGEQFGHGALGEAVAVEVLPLVVKFGQDRGGGAGPGLPGRETPGRGRRRKGGLGERHDRLCLFS